MGDPGAAGCMWPIRARTRLCRSSFRASRRTWRRPGLRGRPDGSGDERNERTDAAGLLDAVLHAALPRAHDARSRAAASRSRTRRAAAVAAENRDRLRAGGEADAGAVRGMAPVD